VTYTVSQTLILAVVDIVVMDVMFVAGNQVHAPMREA
jgi:hypothetical protein